MNTSTLLMLVTFVTGHVVSSQSTSNHDDDVGLLYQESNSIVLSRQARQSRPSVIDELVHEINRISQQLPDIRQEVHNLAPSDAGHCWQQGTPTGWILVQQNYGRSTNFNRTWSDYKNGFGDVGGDYWLGNDRLHQLTSSSGRYKVRFDLRAKINRYWFWAEYSTFRVDDESTDYQMTISGYSGTAGDCFNRNSARVFVTLDRNNFAGCATGKYGLSGGWWWSGCGWAAINASPLLYSDRGNRGFWWGSLPVGRQMSADLQLMTSRMWLVPL